MDTEKIMIMRLQDNLNTLRKICGWTTQELGDKIGVTKQTISNLENKKTQMTKLQYIGLRSVFDHEANSTSENASFLNFALTKLLDEELSQEEMEEYESKMWYAAAAISDGANVQNVSKTFGFTKEPTEDSSNKAKTSTAILAGAAVAGVAVAGATGALPLIVGSSAVANTMASTGAVAGAVAGKIAAGSVVASGSTIASAVAGITATSKWLDKLLKK